MEVLTRFPLTNQEIFEMGGGELVRFPATFDEYGEVLSEADYRADFYNHEIIATMSYETDLHSRLAAQMTAILLSVFSDKKTHCVFNSNRPVFIENCPESPTGVFNTDGMVISLPARQYTFSPGMTAEMTPVFIMEVLSPTTRNYDWGTKLPCYLTIPTLQQLVFMEQTEPKITVFERESPVRWTNTELKNADDFFKIGSREVFLREVYESVYF